MQQAPSVTHDIRGDHRLSRAQHDNAQATGLVIEYIGVANDDMRAAFRAALDALMPDSLSRLDAVCAPLVTASAQQTQVATQSLSCRELSDAYTLSPDMRRRIQTVLSELMLNTKLYWQELPEVLGKNAPQFSMRLTVAQRQSTLEYGQIMHRQSADRIIDRLQFLRALSPKGMRQYEKQCMTKGNPDAESKGSGLGLLHVMQDADKNVVTRVTDMPNTDAVRLLLRVVMNGRHASV